MKLKSKFITLLTPIILFGCNTQTTTTQQANICPETVKLDARREPRNTAGHIRWCWPSEPYCFCDSDNDCYRLEGYVPCIPPNTVADTGLRDSGVDARTDSGRDIGVDSRTDAIIDSRVDTGRDTGVDVREVAVDTGIDVAQQEDKPTPVPTLLAFPGAMEFGALATGGRGGRVIYVTNLNSSGPGSFQDAVQQTGRRYVLFKVSGVINSDVQISNGDLTIAGQTSPGGIIVRGLHTTEEPYCDQQCGTNAKGVQNFIIRHLRSRPANGNFPDGLRLRYSKNGIVDHMSIGNASDEAIEVSYTNTITIQNTILAETLGGHSNYGGMLVNYSNPPAGYALTDLSFIRNNWNRLEGRYPELSRESQGVARTTMRIELSNNLLWDQRYFIDVNPTDISGTNSGNPIYYQMNWIGNYSVARSSNHFGVIWIQGSGTTGTTAFFSDNRSSLWPTRSDWDLNYCCNDYNGEVGTRPSWARSTRFDYQNMSYLPSSQVATYMVGNVGAFPRDTMDTRLMSFVSNNTIDSRAINTNPVNDALVVTNLSAQPPIDTDSDGMPDTWEQSHGLNPSVQDHNGSSLSVSMTGVSGYTNLECYLNELAGLRVLNNR